MKNIMKHSVIAAVLVAVSILVIKLIKICFDVNFLSLKEDDML